MYTAKAFDGDGKAGKARELPEALFDGVVNEAVLHQVVTAQLANRRQGTASGKNRAAVRGGSRKPWRQKGTGRARQGTIRAAQWVGGGMAFPPRPHGWRQHVPKKVRALARRSALNARAQEDRIVVVDGLSFEAPKTKQLDALLDSLEASGKTLILTAGLNTNVYLSARNLPGVEVRTFGQESVYDLLWAQTIVIEGAALGEADGPDEEDVDDA